MLFLIKILFFQLIITLIAGGIIGPVKVVQINDDILEEEFPVSIIHFNDFHARFEEINSNSVGCKSEEGEECIGGYARVVTVVKSLQEKHTEENTNPIYLNAGDNFQGTLWYNMLRWNVTSHFLNMLPADAIALGNHEFDHLVEGVVPFLETLTSPVIVANIDDTLEPTMKGKYQKSIIIDRYDRKIGVIGVILQTTYQIASTGKLEFLDEIESLRAEATRLRETEDVNIIIALSHCGLDVDRLIAAGVGDDIDVIVGGHSHTFLYNGTIAPGPDYVQDTYPVVVTQDSGHVVLIVQASAYTKYIGDITVYFDADGNITRWNGAPIFVDNSIIPDPDVIDDLVPWKEVVDELAKVEIGFNKVQLTKSGCNNAECNIGSFICDAFVHAYVDRAADDEWTVAAIAVTNVGGIRTSLNSGVLTYGDLITTVPFENTLDTMELRGDHILEMLEHSVSESYENDTFVGKYMLQVSGIHVVFNVTNPVGKRVVSVKLLCNKCEIPKYEKLDIEKYYSIIVPSFVAGGGDNFVMIRDNRRNHKIGEIRDIDAVVDYVKLHNPIMQGVDGRITVLT